MNHNPNCALNHLRLVFIGNQEFPGEAPIALWDINQVGHPAHRSTVSIAGLVSYGLLRLHP